MIIVETATVTGDKGNVAYRAKLDHAEDEGTGYDGRDIKVLTVSLTLSHPPFRTL